MDGLKIKMYSFTMDCKEPNALAEFYSKLVKWDIVFTDEDYACIAPPGSKHGAYPCVLFQRNSDYIAPVWPEKSEAQQQMAHIDFAVDDLEKAVAYAIECGARVADSQFSDDWRVMFDPAGHPFCLCSMKSILDSPDCELL